MLKKDIKVNRHFSKMKNLTNEFVLKTAAEVVQLIKDIENDESELWNREYGCEESEHCAGCGWERISEQKILDRLKDLLK